MPAVTLNKFSTFTPSKNAHKIVQHLRTNQQTDHTETITVAVRLGDDISNRGAACDGSYWLGGVMASSSKLVGEKEKMIMAEDNIRSVEEVRWKNNSIYRVPEWHTQLTNAKADTYRPLLVSLGPFHHGVANLQPMEEHKLRAVHHLVRRSGRPHKDFYTAINDVADKLMDAYQDLDDIWRGKKRGCFVQMMVTDGCFLLEMARTLDLFIQDKTDAEYTANDPVFSKHGLYYLFCAIQVDMVVIENQLPLLTLQSLVEVEQSKRPVRT